MKTLPEFVAEAEAHMNHFDWVLEEGFPALRAYFEGLVTGYVAAMLEARGRLTKYSEVYYLSPQQQQLYLRGRSRGAAEAGQVIAESKKSTSQTQPMIGETMAKKAPKQPSRTIKIPAAPKKAAPKKSAPKKDEPTHIAMTVELSATTSAAAEELAAKLVAKYGDLLLVDTLADEAQDVMNEETRAMATALRVGGVAAQVRFLLDAGYSEERIITIASEELGEKEDGEEETDPQG